MRDVQNPSTFDKIVDAFKQSANRIVGTVGAVTGKQTPRFETINDRQAADYQTVVNARNMLQSGAIKDDPRNNNYVYRGVVSPTATPIPLGRPERVKITPIPLGGVNGKKVPLKKNTITPTPTNKRLVPTRTPTATPTPYVPNFDFKGYQIRRPGFEGKTIPQPPAEISKIIYEIFAPTNEATPAAAVAWSENGRFDPTIVADNGDSTDTGIFQINSRTFNGLLKRRPEQMAAIGAKTIEDMKDPRKNALVARLIRMDEGWAGSQPWGQWYGWQGKNAEGKYLGKDINLQEMINKLNRMLAKKKK